LQMAGERHEQIQQASYKSSTRIKKFDWFQTRD